MRNTSLALAVIGALLLTPRGATAADPAVMDDVHVTVRTYDITSLPPETRQAALATATAILRGAGVSVSWRACDAVFVRSAGDPCLAPLGRTELSVRFVRLPPPRGHTGALSLGYALVDTRARKGALATLYVDRVAGLAVNCEMDLGTLLGRAAAHEIGHLLLGTRGHTEQGLMQALWSRDALRATDDAVWVFTTREARAMRDALRVRSAQQLAMMIAN